MKAASMFVPLVALLLTAAVTVRADQTYLEATFDDKTIDAPIGTSGAAAGEPAWLEGPCTATVRSAPFNTPCLEIEQASTPGLARAVFELLDGVDPNSGLVVLVADVWFEELSSQHEYDIHIYSANWGTTVFAMTINWDSGVNVWSTGGPTQTIGSAPTGRSFPILIALNMDARTYSVWLDGTLAALDLTMSPTGEVSHILVGPTQNPVAGSKMWLDQIRVLDWMPTVAIRETTWGKVRALYR
jgi:hypothetical protein